MRVLSRDIFSLVLLKVLDGISGNSGISSNSNSINSNSKSGRPSALSLNPFAADFLEEDACSGNDSSHESCSLHALQVSASAGGSRSRPSASLASMHVSTSECIGVQNKGSFHTVELEVSKVKPSRFQVIADTGSSAVILPSCECRRSGACGFQAGGCLEESSEGSSSFAAKFGSGDIEAFLTSGSLKLGGSKADMKDSLLLMRTGSVQIGSESYPFDGVLGLGPPTSALDAQKADFPGDSDGLPFIASRGFLERAGLGHFSLCLRRDGSDGELRLSSRAPEEPKGLSGSITLGSIGETHWALGFRGVSIDGVSVPGLFCDEQDKRKSAPCMALPDSGTTLMLAPQAHLLRLYESICEAWPRCSKLSGPSPEDKSETFQTLLWRCETWLSEGLGFDELPQLQLHLAGGEGDHEASLQMPGLSYIVETLTDENRLSCAPAFGTLELGKHPVWILGSPLFYEFKVGFNLHGKRPQVTFSRDACGSCDSVSSSDGKDASEARAEGPAEKKKKVSLLGMSSFGPSMGRRPFRLSLQQLNQSRSVSKRIY
eukprot:TRINITY_DN9082_c0_g1_i1.p1 TRINITY_DN9082_c0_g1~~TRINITY_DN9082_c0_g1_i1.p1  ORF type:complete len:545 (-),score=89.64 TRINITY_DN9082_c0_g1_i1:236-1870(-)